MDNRQLLIAIVILFLGMVTVLGIWVFTQENDVPLLLDNDSMGASASAGVVNPDQANAPATNVNYTPAP